MVVVRLPLFVVMELISVNGGMLSGAWMTRDIYLYAHVQWTRTTHVQTSC